MAWDKWKVVKQIDPTISLDGRELYVEMLKELIEKIQETETYNLTGDEEQISHVYCMPTITFFCTDKDDPNKVEIRCYRDRREFVRELKQEDDSYKSKSS